MCCIEQTNGNTEDALSAAATLRGAQSRLIDYVAR
jgi:hypothetical protein